MAKTTLSKLILANSIDSLETHFFYLYLKEHKLKFNKSEILKNYFKSFIPSDRLLEEISSLKLRNIKELEAYLELLIPNNDRKLNGAYFTPDYIIDFIINEVQPKKNATNLDPSCGCGAFLVSLTDYYNRTFGKSVRSIVKENIYGSDILEYNVRRAKLILTIYALQKNEYLKSEDFNLYHQDSLRAKWERKFDNVLGNPPYVKFQDLSDKNRNFLFENWKTIDGGTFNLYFAFFELGIKLLKPLGRLGYITPNNYFTSLSGEALRSFFLDQKCVTRIIDFSHVKIFDAQTYTAITFLSKNVNEIIKYDRIKDNQTPQHFLANANGSPNILQDLNVKKWRLLKSDEQKNIKIIETVGTPIGKLFDISVGIATLKDDVFFVDGIQKKGNYYIKNTQKGTFEIEKDAVRPVYKISDFKKQKDIDKNKRKIIFPYVLKNGIARVIPESEFRIKFPKCYEYLLSEKKILSERDKGKIELKPFFCWGRTQGLAKIGRKLLTPTFSKNPRFLFVDNQNSYYTNGYGLYFKEINDKLSKPQRDLISKIENVDVIQKILNSYIMDYYVSKTSVSLQGGYPCYQKNFIEKFSIPNLSQYEINKIREMDTKAEIDAYLIHKYQLSLPVPNLLS